MSAAARRFLRACLLLAVLLLGPACLYGARAQEGAASPLVIVSAGREHAFTVEVADDDFERQRGLMYRTALAPDAGMLFDFGAARPVSMWMKNTYIPLDMLFIDRGGVIRRVAENTEPFSLKVIASGSPVRFVLELAGGTAQRLGIKPGDTARHALIPAK